MLRKNVAKFKTKKGLDDAHQLEKGTPELALDIPQSFRTAANGEITTIDILIAYTEIAAAKATAQKITIQSIIQKMIIIFEIVEKIKNYF